jgi:hypothetical protein
MPGIPDSSRHDDVSARGTPFALHSYSLESGGDSYVAQTALLSGRRRHHAAARMLQAALDDRAQQLAGGKWASVDWREIDGAAAVRVDRRCAAATSCASSRS